jgi:hypothetical protein
MEKRQIMPNFIAFSPTCARLPIRGEKMISRYIVCLFVMPFLMAGCASLQSVPEMEMAPDALNNVKTIALMPSPEPEVYFYGIVIKNENIIFGLTSVLTGSIGAAALSWGLENNRLAKQWEIDQILQKNVATPFTVILSEGIASELQARGFDGRIEQGPWQMGENGLNVIQFDDIESEADAVLVIGHETIGFIDDSSTKVMKIRNRPGIPPTVIRTKAVRPVIMVNVSLLGRDRKTVLYRGFHAAGWRPVTPNRKIIKGWRFSPAQDSFEDFDALKADPAKMVSALRNAANEIVTSIVNDLVPPQNE